MNDNKKLAQTFAQTTKISQDQITHYVQGTDGNLWVVLAGVPGVKDGSRFPASALIGESK